MYIVENAQKVMLQMCCTPVMFRLADEPCFAKHSVLSTFSIGIQQPVVPTENAITGISHKKRRRQNEGFSLHHFYMLSHGTLSATL
jgi:hypothetical protein